MVKKIKQIINSIRQNLFSYLRKNKLNKETNPALVAHLKVSIDLKHAWYGNSYGGFFIVPNILSVKSIVYSIGIGKDITFDLKCIKNHNLEIYAFDPTPKSINYIQEQSLPTNFKFYPFGITANGSGKEKFYLPSNPSAVSGSLVNHSETNNLNFLEVDMLSFDDMLQINKHDHIDVLKMDIEGAEYEVLEDIIKSSIPISQILVEFHDRLFDLSEYKSKEIVTKLNAAGYEIYAVSKSFEEVSFIHKDALKQLKN